MAMRSQDRDTLHDIDRLGESVRLPDPQSSSRGLRNEDLGAAQGIAQRQRGNQRAGIKRRDESQQVCGWAGNLYLIHPQVNGVREREYIGRDKTVQAAAMARIERWHQLETLRARKSQIEGVLAMIGQRVDDALSGARRV